MPGPFDLERFAPNPYFEFALRGETYRVFSDPDVDDVARMLKIEESVKPPDFGITDEMSEEEVVAQITATNAATDAAFLEGKQMLVDLMREADPDRDLGQFKIGRNQLLGIFAGILYGTGFAEKLLTQSVPAKDGELAADEEPPSVASAVAEALGIAAPDAPQGDGTEAPAGSEDDPDGYVAVEGADVAPLPSAKPSSEQSSPSDEPAGTRQAIGAA